MEGSEVEMLCSPKKAEKCRVLRSAAVFSVKFTGDANGLVMMQAKRDSDTAKELTFAKRFPCQSIKSFHKNKTEEPSSYQHHMGSGKSCKLYVSTKLRGSKQELQEDLQTELPPREVLSHISPIRGQALEMFSTSHDRMCQP